MDCRQVAKQGIAELYVIGQLESSLQSEFEIHVLECKDCLQTLEVLQELRAVLMSPWQVAR
jgi:hypothetical protein